MNIKKQEILNSINNINKLIKCIKIKKIYIDAGGMIGLYYIGMLKYLDEQHLLSCIDDYYGCSIGGLLCGLLILGYSIDELINFATNFDFTSIVKLSYGSIINNYSLTSNHNFIVFIKHAIRLKNYDENITLLQLYLKLNKKINLFTYNLTKNEGLLLNYKNTPDIELWKALYTTCALPNLFPPMFYNDDFYCDGALGNISLRKLIEPIDRIHTIFISVCPNIKNINIHKLLLNKSLKNYTKYIIDFFLILVKQKQYNKIKKCGNILLLKDCDVIDSIQFTFNKKEKINKILIGYNNAKNDFSNLILNIIKNK